MNGFTAGGGFENKPAATPTPAAPAKTNFDKFYEALDATTRKRAVRAYLAASGLTMLPSGNGYSKEQADYMQWAQEHYPFNPPYDPNKKY